VAPVTPIVVFLPVLAIAVGATYAYGFRYRDVNLFLSSGVGLLAWGWCALTAGATALPTAPYGLTSGGRALQYLCLACFLVSLFVFMLAHWSVYPPGEVADRV
jgi:hypothetical protein